MYHGFLLFAKNKYLYKKTKIKNFIMFKIIFSTLFVEERDQNILINFIFCQQISRDNKWYS